MHKIKFIAPKELIEALGILGIETFFAESEPEAGAALKSAASPGDPALIFITERLADYLAEEITRLNRRPEINIVLIPDNRGSIGLAASRIEKLVKNSIGGEVSI